MKKIKIRFLQKEDLEDIEPLLRLMWLSHSKSEYIDENVLKNIDIGKYFQKAVDKKNGFALAAEKDGEIIGVIKVDEIKLEDFFNERKAYYLDDLAVTEKYRKQGVASHLIKEIIKLAEQNKISILKTRIYEFNKPAQELFKKHGIKPLYSEYFKKLK